jgi:hypothetical protein
MSPHPIPHRVDARTFLLVAVDELDFLFGGVNQ